MNRLIKVVFPFRHLSVWLAILVLVVAALAVGVASAFVVPSLRSVIEEDGRVSLRLAVSAAAQGFGQALETQDESEIAKTSQAFFSNTGYESAVVRVVDGGTLVQTATSILGAEKLNIVEQAATTGAITTGEERLQGRPTLAVALPYKTLRNRRYVVVFFSRTSTSTVVADIRGRFIVGAAVAVPLAALLGGLAAGLLARRIRRVERAAREIASGSFAVQPSDPGQDEVAQLAHTFEEMRSQLERIDHARRDFIANASHELRSPLVALGGFLELLEDGDVPPAEQAEYIATMRGQVDRLTRLATDLLDLSRLDAGQLRVTPETVDVTEILHRVNTEFGPRAVQRGIEIDTVTTDQVSATADAVRLEQIVRALVHNALRHTPSGTRVTLAAQTEATLVAIGVSDDGPPIPADLAPKVFDRFARGPTGGSGLGLSIAAQLTERMGGRIFLIQEPDRKTFRVELPAAAPEILPAAAYAVKR